MRTKWTPLRMLFMRRYLEWCNITNYLGNFFTYTYMFNQIMNTNMPRFNELSANS